MTVFVFGNLDYAPDALPLKILPTLKNLLPQVNFEVLDPNEEWEVPDELTIIDTVVGIKAVTIFNDLRRFERTPRLSLHDFDTLTNLRYLEKLGRLKKIKIIGLPPTISEKEAVESVIPILRSSLPLENEQHSSYRDHKPG